VKTYIALSLYFFVFLVGWTFLLSIVGADMVAIVWWLDLQLHVQSVPITTNIVNSNPTQVGCTRYNTMS